MRSHRYSPRYKVTPFQWRFGGAHNSCILNLSILHGILLPGWHLAPRQPPLQNRHLHHRRQSDVPRGTKIIHSAVEPHAHSLPNNTPLFILLSLDRYQILTSTKQYRQPTRTYSSLHISQNLDWKLYNTTPSLPITPLILSPHIYTAIPLTDSYFYTTLLSSKITASPNNLKHHIFLKRG